jgi:hypothetical protein
VPLIIAYQRSCTQTVLKWEKTRSIGDPVSVKDIPDEKIKTPLFFGGVFIFLFLEYGRYVLAAFLDGLELDAGFFLALLDNRDQFG